MYRISLILCAACGLLASTAGAEEYYSCRLPNGRVEMRDSPCPANARPIETHPGRVTVVPKASTPTRPAPGFVIDRKPPAPHPVKATPFVDPEWDAGFIERMLLRARFGGVLSSLHNLRNASMMFNAENGGWPTRAEDMGLDGDNMQTSEIADVLFLRDGTILAKLKPSFGAHKFVGMLPVEELGGAQLGWTCVANFPKSFFGGAFGATCESRQIHGPKPASPAP